MEVNVKLIENGLQSLALIDSHGNMGTLVGTRQEIRQMMRDLADQISITKDLVGKTVRPKSNPDYQIGRILGILSDSDNVHVIWSESLHKTYEHIDDLTVLN